MWVATGQRVGPFARVFNDEQGGLVATELGPLRDVITGVREHVVPRPLRSDLEHGAAAGLELFLLVKAWKLPYHHRTNRCEDLVRVAGKTLGLLGEAGLPDIPSLGGVPAFSAALRKFASVVEADGDAPLEFRTLGPKYLAQRR
jgi:hypothetical protein